MSKPNPDGPPENTAANLAAIGAGKYDGYIMPQAKRLRNMLRGYADGPTFDDAKQILYLAACYAAKKHDPRRASFSTFLLHKLRFAASEYRECFFRRGRSADIAIRQSSQFSKSERHELPPEPAYEDEHVDELDYKLVLETVRRAIDKLPSERTRNVLRLRLQGLGQVDIGRELDIDQKTVHVVLKRGIELLQNVLRGTA